MDLILQKIYRWQDRLSVSEIINGLTQMERNTLLQWCKADADVAVKTVGEDLVNAVFDAYVAAVRPEWM